MNYRNFEDLEVIMVLLDEVNDALGDPEIRIGTSKRYATILGTLGLGIGAAIGYTALYKLGETGYGRKGITSGIESAGDLVGGGTVPGVLLLKTPAIVLGSIGLGLGKRINKKKFKKTKEELYRTLLEKQVEIFEELYADEKDDDERLDYLYFLNSCINSTLKDLKDDLC